MIRLAQPTVPGSPEWWRDLLVGKLNERRDGLQLLSDYYENKAPLTRRATKEQLDQFRERMEQARTSWATLVVDAVNERLSIVGFRSEVDSPAWQIWQRSQLDAEQQILHEMALTTGSAYLLVWPSSDGAVITAEDPSQTIIAYEPGSSRRRRAALKHWRDELTETAWLYLPDVALSWTRKVGRDDWTAGEELLDNRTGLVPIVELRANRRLKPAPYGGGRSEFAAVRSIIDRINASVFDRMFVSDFGAWPQKVVTGFTLERDADGNAKPPPFVASPNRIWVAEDENAKFSQLAAADLRAYIAQEDADVKALAAISRTPPYYLLGEMVNLAAEAIAASEAGLVAKAKRHQMAFGEVHEEAIRIGLLMEGADAASDVASEVVWSDPAVTSISQRADAATKLKAADVPWRARMESMGYTPQQIVDMDGQRTADALTMSLAAPAPAVPGAA